MRYKAFCFLLAVLCICTVAFGSEEPAENQDPSPFSGALTDSVLTVISFVVLLLVLWKLAWKPMLAGLNSRQEYIEKQINEAQETKKQADQILADYKKKLENVEYEGKKIIDTHVKKAENQGQGIIAKAKDDISAMKLKMEADIERQRSEAQAQLWLQAGEIVLTLGKEVLGRALNDDDNQRLTDQAIERLRHEESKSQDSAE